MALLLALSSLLSRLLGVIRNSALATTFGAGEASDAYFAAFQIPDTIYQLLVFGAISAAFVPTFLLEEKQNKEKAWVFVNSLTWGLLAFMSIICLFFVLFAKQSVSLLYPQMSDITQNNTVELLRIMLLSPLFFTLSSLFAGIQNAKRNFWGFALAPIVYNIGILFGIWVLSPQLGIKGVAWGVVAGSFLHAFVQGINAIRLGFKPQLVFSWSPALKKVFQLGLPRVISMASYQMNFFIEGIIATSLASGSLTILRYAQDVQSFPIGIIGVSIAISSFSILSNLLLENKNKQFKNTIEKTLEQILILSIPACFGLYLLRFELVSFILSGGEFNELQVALTSETLRFLSFGLVAAAVTPLLNRSFFSLHNTIIPLITSLFSVFSNLGLALFFTKILGVQGIGLSSAISLSAGACILLFLLQKHYTSWFNFHFYKSVIWCFIASSIMSYIVFLTQNNLLPVLTSTSSRTVIFIHIIILSSVGASVYMFALLLIDFKRYSQILRDIIR